MTTAKDIKSLKNELHLLEERIKEVEKRLPAHSVPPPIMSEQGLTFCRLPVKKTTVPRTNTLICLFKWEQPFANWKHRSVHLVLKKTPRPLTKMNARNDRKQYGNYMVLVRLPFERQ